jgi:hypothetical protein
MKSVFVSPGLLDSLRQECVDVLIEVRPVRLRFTEADLSLKSGQLKGNLLGNG